jgi:hypothetical protein
VIDIHSATPTIGSLRRLSVLAATLVIVVVACSGGDDSDTAAAAAAEPAASDAPASTDASAEGDDEATATDAPAEGDVDAPAALDFGSGTGSITLGDETFELAIGPGTGSCRDVFGIIQAGGQVSDGRDIKGGFMISPLDWEAYADGRYDPPAVDLEITSTGPDNGRWRADAAWAEENDKVGMSQVDSYEMDGLTASGTATFANSWDSEAESVEGSFQISCAEA